MMSHKAAPILELIMTTEFDAQKSGAKIMNIKLVPVLVAILYSEWVWSTRFHLNGWNDY